MDCKEFDLCVEFFNEKDLSGNPNVVNFNGKNVNFTHVDGEVNIIKDLVVNGDVTVNGSITRTPGNNPNTTASTLTGDQDIYGKVKIIQDDFAVSDDFVDMGFDVTANTHIRGHLTVDGDFNFEKAVLKNMIQGDHQTIRMSERVIIENNHITTKTIQITSRRVSFVYKIRHSQRSPCRSSCQKVTTTCDGRCV